MNNVIHEATGFTPYEMFSGKDQPNPIQEVIQFPPSAQTNYDS